MARGLKLFLSASLLSVLLFAPPVQAAEQGQSGAVQVTPLQDDRRPPPVSSTPVPEPQPPVPFGAGGTSPGSSGQPGSPGAAAVPESSAAPGTAGASGGGSFSSGAAQDGPQQSGTVLAYLIELNRRQNVPCPSGAVAASPPPPLIFSEPLCAVAREVAAGGNVEAVLAAKGLSAARWRSFSAAERVPQDAVARLRGEYCEALMADVTHIGAVYEGGRWWVVMAALGRTTAPRNGTAPAGPGNGTAPAAAPGQGKEAAALLALLNDVRSKGTNCRGKAMPSVGPLKTSPKLAQAARKHAEDMAEKRYFGTVSPSGMTLEKRAMEAQYPWKVITELIAKGPPPVSAVLDLWLSSPTQCEQLMDPTLTDAGIGYSNEYWALVMGLEAAGANLPPNEEPPGYGSGAARPAPASASPMPATRPLPPAPALQRRK